MFSCSICPMKLLPVISHFHSDHFSHRLIPSTSRLRINYTPIERPLGEGIDIHRPPSAPSTDVYSSTIHYTRITLFIVACFSAALSVRQDCSCWKKCHVSSNSITTAKRYPGSFYRLLIFNNKNINT